MLPSRCRLWFAIVSMICAAHSVLAGEDMSITAPTEIKPESRVTISWSGGKATFTVRILVNSHESSESKSISDTWYTWTAQGVKDGDQVQFYVYDSAGASTKSPHIPVRLKTDSSDTSSETGGSTTKTAGTYSQSKVTSEGGNEVVKGTKTTTTSTTSGTRSGRIPTAPPQSSDVPESTIPPSSGSDMSSLSSSPTASELPAPETVAVAAATVSGAPTTASTATPSSTGATASTSPDRTNLYLGLIGILIALVLLLVLVWWWRKQTGSSARDDDDDDSRRRTRQDQEQYQSLPKKVVDHRRARMRCAQRLNVAERALLRSEEGQSSDFGEDSEAERRTQCSSKPFAPAVPLLGRTRSSDPG